MFNAERDTIWSYVLHDATSGLSASQLRRDAVNFFTFSKLFVIVNSVRTVVSCKIAGKLIDRKALNMTQNGYPFLNMREV
jgi:hypothetical protein